MPISALTMIVSSSNPGAVEAATRCSNASSTSMKRLAELIEHVNEIGNLAGGRIKAIRAEAGLPPTEEEGEPV